LAVSEVMLYFSWPSGFAARLSVLLGLAPPVAGAGVEEVAELGGVGVEAALVGVEAEELLVLLEELPQPVRASRPTARVSIETLCMGRRFALPAAFELTGQILRWLGATGRFDPARWQILPDRLDWRALGFGHSIRLRQALAGGGRLPGRAINGARDIQGTAMITAAAMTPVHQVYLLRARQMRALSLSAHIPLVCFGIAFPAMVLFVEWLYLRSGDELYRTLARRWTRLMTALFAVGVITGTILPAERIRILDRRGSRLGARGRGPRSPSFHLVRVPRGRAVSAGGYRRFDLWQADMTALRLGVNDHVCNVFDPITEFVL
jgi:Cytochrome bd terminal oxidase subunit I